MKYLLGGGFVVTQKYKKDPIVRIKIDDTFLDEYTLDNCPNYNKQWARDTNIWIYQRDYTTYFHKKIQEDPPYALFNTKEVKADSQFPTNFKLYVLDEDKLKSKKLLEVEVQNADSNYTNGFMTKSTLLDFFTFLVPIPFIKFFSKGGEDIRKQFNEAIIDDRYAYTNFPLNHEALTENNKSEIGYMMVNRFVRIKGTKFRTEGYPFAVKTFWNNKLLETQQFGGSGTFAVDLLTRPSGMVMFDTYDDEFIKLQQQGDIDADGGVHMSEKFFSMVHQNKFDKYLHNENQ